MMQKPSNSSFIKFFAALIVILFVAMIAGFFYRIGYLPFWGRQIAQIELTRYAASNFGSTTPVACTFDWYNGKYTSTADSGVVLDYRLQKNSIYDETLSSQINRQADADYERIHQNAPPNLQLPKDITVWTEVSSRNYALKAQRLYLLGVFNDEALSETESLKAPARIAMNIIERLGDSYHFTGIQLSYGDKNGMYEIIIPADTFDALTKEKLLKHTTKIESDKLPESYLLWLAEKH